MTLLERIKYLCKMKNISQRALERELNLGNGATSKWAKSSPSMDIIKKLSDFFGVTVDYLMSGEEKFKETPYFIDDEAREIAQEIANRKDLKILFDTTRDVSADDLKFVIDLVERIKKGQDVN